MRDGSPRTASTTEPPRGVYLNALSTRLRQLTEQRGIAHHGDSAGAGSKAKSISRSMVLRQDVARDAGTRHSAAPAGEPRRAHAFGAEQRQQLVGRRLARRPVATRRCKWRDHVPPLRRALQQFALGTQRASGVRN